MDNKLKEEEEEEEGEEEEKVRNELKEKSFAVCVNFLLLSLFPPLLFFLIVSCFFSFSFSSLSLFVLSFELFLSSKTILF